jgi:hypothetical protein
MSSKGWTYEWERPQMTVAKTWTWECCACHNRYTSVAGSKFVFRNERGNYIKRRVCKSCYEGSKTK